MKLFRKAEKRIYLDHASTTPISPSVLSKMHSYERENFGNSSALYKEGVVAKKCLEEERTKLARAMQVRPEEIYFTSGGTESDNLAILGAVQKWQENNPGKNGNVIISSIEHAAVLDTVYELQKKEIEVRTIPISSLGVVRTSDVESLITDETILVSVMYANNEIGTIQPVGAIGRVVRSWRDKNNSEYPLLHTDACQAGNYLPVDAPRLKADMISINASKIYGPKGVGALFVRNGIKISPQMIGGGQEKGLRSGTEPVTLVIGMSESFIEAQKMREKESERLFKIQKYAFGEIEKKYKYIKINGDRENRLPNNIHLTVPGITGEELVIRLDNEGFAVSAKSACSSIETDGSYVIIAIGGIEIESKQTLRITMGRDTEKKDIDRLLTKIDYIVKKYKNDIPN